VTVVFRAVPLLVAAAIIAGCGNSSGQAAEGAPADAGAGGRGGRGGPPGGVTAVEIAIAERGTIVRTSTLTGTVEPIRRVGVNSQVGGAILSIGVEEGSVVRTGQVLARLDATEIEAQLTSANAALTAAQSAMERAEKLRAAQIYTDIEYERDRTALAAALSQRDQLQTRLGYATVKSPLDGVVVEKRVESGDIVGSQARLFTVADVSTLIVRVNVSELDVSYLRAGDQVDMTVDALAQQNVRATIRRIFPMADSVSRLVPVELSLAGAGVRDVKPGFLARATFHSTARENAVLVPASAIVVSGGLSAVYLVRSGNASRQNVSTGLTSEGRVEILDGVTEGDTVIVAGNIAVRDGAPVRIVDPARGDSIPTRGALQGPRSTGAAGGE
jgi:membrane fusion protein (multidrug efflux system)